MTDKEKRQQTRRKFLDETATFFERMEQHRPRKPRKKNPTKFTYGVNRND